MIASYSFGLGWERIEGGVVYRLEKDTTKPSAGAAPEVAPPPATEAAVATPAADEADDDHDPEGIVLREVRWLSCALFRAPSRGPLLATPRLLVTQPSLTPPSSRPQ